MHLNGKAKIFLAKNGIFIAIILLAAFFTFINSNFLSFQNATNIAKQAAELGVVALPIAFLLMSGAIDLSVGSIASASAILGGLTMVGTGNAWGGIAVALAFGAVAGAINGVLVSYLGYNPFVVTLGTLSVWSGLALLLTNANTIPRNSLPDDFKSLGSITVGPLPLQIVILIIAIVIAWYVLNRTQFGRQVLAVGGNKRAARLMGIKAKRTQFLLFVATGTSAALAGIMYSAKLQSANPNVGSGLELNVLIVVLLGGIAFEGGAGRIAGVVGGLLFYRVMLAGLAFIQASPYLQKIFVGAVLVAAVALDSTIQNIMKNTWAQLGKSAVQTNEDKSSEESESAR